MFFVSLAALALYGIIHSIMASARFKARIRATTGSRLYDGFYRLFYNVIGTLTFIPVALIVLLVPGEVLWQIDMPGATVLLAVQTFSGLALIAAVLQADPLRFAGIKQVLAYLREEPLPLPAESLQTGGLYGLVRHPLYLFGLLTIWPTPVMTAAYLGFAVGTTAYCIIGSRLEERRLAAEFGPTYRQYQQRVPWLFPWPRPRSQ